MAQGKICGRGSFSSMRVSIGRHARVGCRRAQRCQLLSHWPQFRRGHKRQLDLMSTGSATPPLCGAHILLFPSSPGSRPPGAGSLRAGRFRGTRLGTRAVLTSRFRGFLLLVACRRTSSVGGLRVGRVKPFPLSRSNRNQGAQQDGNDPRRSMLRKRGNNWVHSFNV
jgi:hypothetical protein